MTAQEIVERNSYLPDLDWKNSVVTDKDAIKLMIDFATYHVEKALKAVAGVETAVVDLEKKQAVVTGNAVMGAMREAVEDAGYEVVE